MEEANRKRGQLQQKSQLRSAILETSLLNNNKHGIIAWEENKALATGISCHMT